jgi:hypothetical protein
MGDCEAIPVAAGHISGAWGTGDRLWRTGDCGAVADFEGDCWVGRIVKSSKLKERKRKEGKR